MRILLVFRGNIGAIVGDGRSIPEILAERGTSHPSEVNALLVAHWLQVDHGHEVHWQCERDPGRPRDWLLTPAAPDADLSNFDAVLTWKIPGVRLAQALGLFERVNGHRFGAWFDAGGFAAILDPREASRYTHVLWGTAEHFAAQREDFPGARSFVVEHATGILSDVDPEPRSDRGVYFGRLPTAYLRGICDLSQRCGLDVFALQAPEDAGIKGWSLRPGRYDDEMLATARADFAEKIGDGDAELHPAVNLSAHHAEMSGYLFGFVPPTRPRPPQTGSASKAWDCWGLGLPVVMGCNVPEARRVTSAPLWLGELYDSAIPATLDDALKAIRRRADDRGQFLSDRRAIAEWVREGHTYRQRAKEIHDAISG